MPTRNISLTETLDRFVEDRVESGEFQNASEVVRAGLRMLKSDAETEAAKLVRLRALVQEGLDDIAQGRFEEVDDIAAWVDGLRRTAPSS